jgi:hypothetical protein
MTRMPANLNPWRPAIFDHPLPRRAFPGRTSWSHMMKRLAALLLAVCLGVAPAAAQTVAQTTNGSVTITTGNTFQTALSAVTNNNQRRSLTIANNNATDSCWLFIGAGSATKATSILLLPGGAYTRYYPYVPSDAIQATCTTTSDSLYVDVQ